MCWSCFNCNGRSTPSERFRLSQPLEHRSIPPWLWKAAYDFYGFQARCREPHPPCCFWVLFFFPTHKRWKSNAGKWSANMIPATFIVRVENTGLTIFSMFAAVGLTFLLKWLCRLTISSWTVLFVPGHSAAETHTGNTQTCTHTHLKPMGKQQIKDIMKSDVYSGGFISTIWLTKHILV